MLIIFEYKFNKIDKQVFPKLKGYTYVHSKHNNYW